MHIARYSTDDGARWGVVLGDELAPLDHAERPRESIAHIPAETLRAMAARAEERAPRISLGDVNLLAPIPDPSKVLAIGLNYGDHIAESGLQAPEVPTVFTKLPTTIVGPADEVHRPRVSEALDYEGELGVVIGVPCRHVPRERAFEVVAGYVVLNDISVRDWQLASPQWSLAKSFDTHMPSGPWLTLADDLDPSDLTLQTYVNDEIRQSSSTRHLVYDTPDLIAFLSQACTLLPGDIIATGTPAGVGGAMTPPVYLRPGDEIRVSIDGIGEIANRVIDEPPTTARIGDERLLGAGQATHLAS